MRKTTLRITKVKVSRGGKKQIYHCVTLPKPGGGRTRRFFRFTPEGKRGAETFLQSAKIQQTNYGIAAFGISDTLRAEAVDCAARLAAVGHTLSAATKFFLDHLNVRETSIPIGNAIEELINSRRSLGLTERYCRDLRLRLSRFANAFPERIIASITAREIEKWLDSLHVAAGTRNTFRRDLRTLFSYCEKRGYCPTNEARKTERAKNIDKPVVILTVDQASALLSACDNETIAYAAVSMFAGLRASEVQKLDWSEVDFESGLIEVTAAKSKTAQRRLVPIAENLAMWIRPLAKRRGRLAPEGLRKRFDDVKARAGLLPWPQNAMRHSFGSYRLTQCQDAARVSLEMGNSPQMVFSHYRELVKPKQAQRYWQLAPDKDQKKIVRSPRPHKKSHSTV